MKDGTTDSPSGGAKPRLHLFVGRTSACVSHSAVCWCDHFGSLGEARLGKQIVNDDSYYIWREASA